MTLLTNDECDECTELKEKIISVGSGTFTFKLCEDCLLDALHKVEANEQK